MHLCTPLLCAKFQGNRIWNLRFIAVSVSVQKEEEKQEEKMKKLSQFFEVAYLGNA